MRKHIDEDFDRVEVSVDKTRQLAIIARPSLCARLLWLLSKIKHWS